MRGESLMVARIEVGKALEESSLFYLHALLGAESRSLANSQSEGSNAITAKWKLQNISTIIKKLGTKSCVLVGRA